MEDNRSLVLQAIDLNDPTAQTYFAEYRRIEREVQQAEKELREAKQRLNGARVAMAQACCRHHLGEIFVSRDGERAVLDDIDCYWLQLPTEGEPEILLTMRGTIQEGGYEKPGRVVSLFGAHWQSLTTRHGEESL